jgi:hypothetical protein
MYKCRVDFKAEILELYNGSSLEIQENIIFCSKHLNNH